MNNKKWILILGSNSDVAKSIAFRFAKDGYNLILASRDKEQGLRMCSNLKIRYSIESSFMLFDATKYDSHSAFFSKINQDIEGVILAFGIMHDQIKSQNEFTLSHSMVSTNYLGYISVLEIIAKKLESKQSGFIAAITSVAGDRGRGSNYIYGSTKSALSTYLDGLRHRLYNSKVNVINIKPGFIDTKMTTHLDLPTKLTANTDEVAELVFKAINKKKNNIYVKPIWKFIMLVVKKLPYFIFHRTKL